MASSQGQRRRQRQEGRQAEDKGAPDVATALAVVAAFDGQAEGQAEAQPDRARRRHHRGQHQRGRGRLQSAEGPGCGSENRVCGEGGVRLQGGEEGEGRAQGNMHIGRPQWVREGRSYYTQGNHSEW